LTWLFTLFLLQSFLKHHLFRYYWCKRRHSWLIWYRLVFDLLPTIPGFPFPLLFIFNLIHLVASLVQNKLTILILLINQIPI
jgi:hypothetical protein